MGSLRSFINSVIPAKACPAIRPACRSGRLTGGAGIYRVLVWMPACAGMTLIIFLVLIFQGCSSTAPQARAHFEKANESYKKGDFDSAIKEYEAIVSLRFSSTEVYYNLGNSYFKKNQLGKAVVNYERAFALAPRDGDIKANLKYARDFVKNYQAQNSDLGWERIFIHNDLVTVNEITLILAFIFVAAGIIFVIGLFAGWPPRKMRVVLFLAGVLFIFHYAALVVKIEEQKNQAVILVEGTARFEPEDNATVHFQMSPGWKVKIVEESGEWVKLMRWDGKQGWTPRYTLEKIE